LIIWKVGFKATKPHIIIWTIICDAAYIDEWRSKENVFVNVFNIMTIKIPCILNISISLSGFPYVPPETANIKFVIILYFIFCPIILMHIIKKKLMGLYLKWVLKPIKPNKEGHKMNVLMKW
jgi:hypothetical protein